MFKTIGKGMDNPTVPPSPLRPLIVNSNYLPRYIICNLYYASVVSAETVQTHLPTLFCLLDFFLYPRCSLFSW